MPSSIKAYQLAGAGTSFELSAVSRTLPEPGAGEVMVQIGAVSLNYRDILIRQGKNGAVREGLIPLSDGAGTVVAIGPEVSRWKVGDRVAPTFFASWHAGPFRRNYLPSALGGGQLDGVLSEQIIASEKALVAIPDYLSLEEAATLPCAAVTAWHALFARGGLQPGETVLIQGTGGVALFALQLAVAQGARAIVLSSSDEKLARARILGAWETVNYRTHPAWHEEVMRITDGLGASHVLELGGPDTFERSIASVAAGGNIAQIGVLTGFGPTPNLLPLQFMNASILGICVGSGEHFSDLTRFLRVHAIKPVIDRTFTFDEAAAAYDYLATGRHFGKVVMTL